MEKKKRFVFERVTLVRRRIFVAVVKTKKRLHVRRPSDHEMDGLDGAACGSYDLHEFEFCPVGWFHMIW